MVTETLELLELWEPGMTVGELKARVRAMGALGKATQVRVDDLWACVRPEVSHRRG